MSRDVTELWQQLNNINNLASAAQNALGLPFRPALLMDIGRAREAVSSIIMENRILLNAISIISVGELDLDGTKKLAKHTLSRVKMIEND